MGSGKKEAARKERQSKTGDGMGNVRTKGENFYRCVHLNRVGIERSDTDRFALGMRRS